MLQLKYDYIYIINLIFFKIKSNSVMAMGNKKQNSPVI